MIEYATIILLGTVNSTINYLIAYNKNPTEIKFSVGFITIQQKYRVIIRNTITYQEQP